MKEPNEFFILVKDQQKWIFECSLGYGEIEKDEDSICYFFNGLCHREDGPAIEYSNGTKIWYKEGNLHREDGPSVEYYNGDKEWYKYGIPHRLDGPAVDCISTNRKHWWLYGTYYKNKYEYEMALKQIGLNI